MKPNLLIRIALKLSGNSWSVVTLSNPSGFGFSEEVFMFGKKGKK